MTAAAPDRKGVGAGLRRHVARAVAGAPGRSGRRAAAEGDGVAPAGLGPVERPVGLRQKRLDIRLASGRSPGGASATPILTVTGTGRAAPGRATGVSRTNAQSRSASCGPPRAPCPACAMRNSSPPMRAIRASARQRRLHPPRDMGQDPVTGGVAEAVIDGLEMVEIGQHDGEGAPVGAARARQPPQEGQRVAAVVEPCQRVQHRRLKAGLEVVAHGVVTPLLIQLARQAQGELGIAGAAGHRVMAPMSSTGATRWSAPVSSRATNPGAPGLRRGLQVGDQAQPGLGLRGADTDHEQVGPRLSRSERRRAGRNPAPSSRAGRPGAGASRSSASSRRPASTATRRAGKGRAVLGEAERGGGFGLHPELGRHVPLAQDAAQPGQKRDFGKGLSITSAAPSRSAATRASGSAAARSTTTAGAEAGRCPPARPERGHRHVRQRAAGQQKVGPVAAGHGHRLGAARAWITV